MAYHQKGNLSIMFIKTKTLEGLSLKGFLWQGYKDSNLGHAVLETAALPTELHPYVYNNRYFIT